MLSKSIIVPAYCNISMAPFTLTMGRAFVLPFLSSLNLLWLNFTSKKR